MSHRASKWLAEIAPDRMTSGAFRVLFHLCDAHNSMQAPELACFPSQARLMNATGLSNGGLNKILNDLESAGLIIRRRTRGKDGKKGPTYYILGCDGEISPPSPQSGDGETDAAEVVSDADSGDEIDPKTSSTISTFGASPSPLFAPHHLHRSGDKPVREPGRERASARASESDLDQLAMSWVAPVKRCHAYAAIGISQNVARHMITMKLVTIDELRRVGVVV